MSAETQHRWALFVILGYWSKVHIESSSQYRLSIARLPSKTLWGLAMLKGKNKSLDEDEKTVRPRDNSIEERFFGPRGGEIPS
jgi:hypothetical protein